MSKWLSKSIIHLFFFVLKIAEDIIATNVFFDTSFLQIHQDSILMFVLYYWQM
jgi:hypothetical protein